MLSLVLFLEGCGVSQKDFDSAQARIRLEQARVSGLEEIFGFYQNFIDAKTGKSAEEELSRIDQKLSAIKLNYADIKLSREKLEQRVSNLKAADAAAAKMTPAQRRAAAAKALKEKARLALAKSKGRK
jgi:hypothetical protein